MYKFMNHKLLYSRKMNIYTLYSSFVSPQQAMNISVRSFCPGTTPGLNPGSSHSSQARQCIPLDILTYASSTGSRSTCLHGGRAINHFYTLCISRHIPHGLRPTHRHSETPPVRLGSFSLQLILVVFRQQVTAFGQK